MAFPSCSVVVKLSRNRIFKSGKKGYQSGVDKAVPARSRGDPVQGLDEPRAEKIHGPEGQLPQRMFGLAFHPGPHDAALAGVVRSGAGHVDEGHGGIEAGQGPGRGEGKVVVHPAVRRFVQARGGRAEAEKAGVQSRQFSLDRAVLEEIPVDDLLQLGMRPSRGHPHEGNHSRHPRIRKAFAQRALADHARGAEQDHLHGALPWTASGCPFEVARMGASAAVCHGRSGHQRWKDGGASGSTL